MPRATALYSPAEAEPAPASIWPAPSGATMAAAEEIGHFDVQAFVAEVALLVRDVDRRVARAAGRPDRYRLRGRCADWRRQSIQQRARDKPEQRLLQARFLPCDRMSAIYHPHGRAPQGLANVAIGTLAPERLDLGQGRMGVGCIFHNRVEAGV